MPMYNITVMTPSAERSKQVNILLTDEQFAELEKRRKQLGLSRSAYVRMRLLAAEQNTEPKPKPSQGLSEK